MLRTSPFALVCASSIVFVFLCANCSCPAIEICNTVNMYANQSDFESWLQEQLPVLCAPPYPLLC